MEHCGDKLPRGSPDIWVAFLELDKMGNDRRAQDGELVDTRTTARAFLAKWKRRLGTTSRVP
jgi:hypothetical protein